ncbi:hypothetical protein DXG01_002169 [Tephrocybe rancida]|nr:hypothetical protein DXG01_002169 [Tephrocybe rancida]
MLVDGGFGDPIVSSLPYVATTHTLDSKLAKRKNVMIGEESVVGLQFDHETALSAIQVFSINTSSHT